MHFATIIVIFFVGSCLAASRGRRAIKSDEPEIDGSTVIVPVTEVNNGTTPKPTLTTTTTLTTSTTDSTTSSTTSTTKVTTTSPITPITVTQAPHSTMSPYIDRKFDGPSFIGGMILALGMMAIAFVALKFYKSRSEQNYHTL